MEGNTIITISRQFGSGGHQIGERLAKALDIPLFDKAAVAQAAKDYGLYESFMTEPAPTRSLLFSIAANMYPLGKDGLSFEQRVYMAEEETMRNLRREGSCIFVGRAADAIFRKDPGCVSFFIHAPFDRRAACAARNYDIPISRAKSITRQMDKKRASYYAERADTAWGDAQTYHLSIDSSLLGLDGTAEHLLAFLRALRS